MSADHRELPFLFVGDDPQQVQAARRVAGPARMVMTVRTAQDALAVLAERDVVVLVVAQDVSGFGGVELCRRAGEQRPQTLCVLVAAPAGLPAAIEAMNAGQVGRCLVPPVHDEALADALRAALDAAQEARTRHALHLGLLRAAALATAANVDDALVHNLASPIGALEIDATLIADALQTVRDGGCGPQRLRELLAEATEAHGDSVVAIRRLREVLASARQRKRPMRATKAASCDAARIVGATVRLLGPEVERVGRLCFVREASPWVAMDAVVLAQIVSSLVLHRVAAASAGADGTRCITVSVGEADAQGIVRVADSGSGLAPDHPERHFDAARPAADGGQLGLGVWRELAARAGGSLQAHGGFDHGTTFTMRLPLAKAPRNR